MHKTVSRWDGETIRVAPASLKKHGLKDGQVLTKSEWEKIGCRLAIEWVEYVEPKTT